MPTGRNLSFLKNLAGGIFRLNFELKERGRFFFRTQNPEQTGNLSRLLSGKVSPENGHFENPKQKYFQSDRWFFKQDRFIDRSAETWLGLNSSPFFRFGSVRKSKIERIEKLGARRFLHTPVYRLKEKDLIDFTLLSLTFQSSGFLILSEIWNYLHSETEWKMFQELSENSETGICFISHEDLPKKIQLPKILNTTFIQNETSADQL